MFSGYLSVTPRWANKTGRFCEVITPGSSSFAPNPPPRTWTQFYSEYRQGAAEYVEPPGPKAPIINNPIPSDQTQNVQIQPTLSIDVYDFQRDPFSVTLQLLHQGNWITLASFSNQQITNMTQYTTQTTGYCNLFQTTYEWRVITIDNKNNQNIKTFSFTTKNNPGNNAREI